MKNTIYLAFPEIKLASPRKNTLIIQELLDGAQDSELIILPALSLTGDGLGSLFNHPSILKSCQDSLANLKTKIPTLLGLPLKIEDRLFSVMAYLDTNGIGGYFPLKSKERVFSEPQLFPKDMLAKAELFDLTITLDDDFNTPYTSHDFSSSPSLYMACPESYSISGGIHSGEYYFQGQEEIFGRWNKGLVRLELELDSGMLRIESFKSQKEKINSPTPFLREDRDYQELLDYQARAYGKKLVRTGLSHSLIGVSGGLDSTWALIAIKKAHEFMNLPLENIHCIIMPGFGSSKDTLKSATDLVESLGLSPEIISIDAAVLGHFRDINHDPEIMDLVYENSQARERTQILMDLANKYKGLVVGTGDMSEIALGWSTYNGDQMSMYGVNASLPKTLIKDLIHWYADKSKEKLQASLYHILDRPISPELLPPDKTGAIVQRTEDLVGKYEIIDLILYHFLQGETIEGIDLQLYRHYPKLNPEERKENLARFFSRFISQQFKRTASPHGIRLTRPSLVDFDMAADLSSIDFLEEIEKL